MKSLFSAAPSLNHARFAQAAYAGRLIVGQYLILDGRRARFAGFFNGCPIAVKHDLPPVLFGRIVRGEASPALFVLRKPMPRYHEEPSLAARAGAFVARMFWQLTH